MAVYDDRTFIRHFSWVLGGLVGVTIFFIFLAFLIVGLSGVESHQGYTFVPPQKQQQQKSAAAGAVSATAAGTAGSGAGPAVAANAASGGNGGPGAAAAAAGTMKKATASNSSPDGQAVWQAHCSMCHQTGLVGAPKIGDKQAWAEILSSSDMKTIFQRDINGYTGKLGTMPPKGGDPSLSDDEVIAAAKYMIGQSGGNPGS
jgi:cytochrome c5